jgi:hypothetical protein
MHCEESPTLAESEQSQREACQKDDRLPENDLPD